MQQNNDVGNNQENLLRFLPKADEQSLELQRLFNLIDDQIDLFIDSESNSIPRAQLNRLVAGHLCKDDVKELQVIFTPPEVEKPGKTANRGLNSWQKFLSVKKADNNDLGGTGRFSGSPRMAKEWAAMTPEEKRTFRDMEIASNARNKKRRMNADRTDDDKTIRSEQYYDAISEFERSMAGMLDTFDTHMILMAITDTRSTYLFSPCIKANSDIAKEAVDSLEGQLGASLWDELKRHVDIKGKIGQSILHSNNVGGGNEISNHGNNAECHEISNYDDDNANDSTLDPMPYIEEESRSRMLILDRVNELFLEAYNKVEPGKRAIQWMKILEKKSSKVELKGLPTSSFFHVDKPDGGATRKFAVPIATNKKNGKKYFDLKLLNKQELLYLEKFLVTGEIFFQMKG